MTPVVRPIAHKEKPPRAFSPYGTQGRRPIEYIIFVGHLALETRPTILSLPYQIQSDASGKIAAEVSALNQSMMCREPYQSCLSVSIRSINSW
jgi:hypothetical protein